MLKKEIVIIWKEDSIYSNNFNNFNLTLKFLSETRFVARSRRDTHGHLVLDARDVEQRLDLLPQLPPRPGAELEVFPQVPLDDHKSQALLLEFFVILTGDVTPDVSLHPGHDLAKTLIAKLLHLTQNSSTEEHLFFREQRGSGTLREIIMELPRCTTIIERWYWRWSIYTQLVVLKTYNNNWFEDIRQERSSTIPIITLKKTIYNYCRCKL